MATQLVLPDYNPRGFSRYVSGAAYVGDIHRGQMVRLNLGAPAALSAAGILSAQSIATAVTVTSFAATYDTVNGLSGRYGRNVTMVASGAATSTVRVRGYDWLGQAMSELFTLNGTTTVQGVKAFKYVTAVVVVTTTGATTVNVGWGDRFGLPVKCLDTGMSYEDGVAKSFGVDPPALLTTEGQQAGAGTGTNTINAPFDGWLVGHTYDVTTGQATAASTITLTVAGSAAAGMTITVPVAAAGLAGGAMQQVADWVAVVAGDAIVYTGVPGTGTAGVVTLHTHFSKGKPGARFAQGVATDPQTQTTRDPRGLFTPASAANGTIVYEVEVYPDFDFTFGVAHNYV